MADRYILRGQLGVEELARHMNKTLDLSNQICKAIKRPNKISWNVDTEDSYSDLEAKSIVLDGKLVGDFDALVGVAIHEAAHLRWTTNPGQNFLNDLPLKFIWNIVEDVEIEDEHLNHLYPGLRDYVLACRDRYLPVKEGKSLFTKDASTDKDLINILLFALRRKEIPLTLIKSQAIQALMKKAREIQEDASISSQKRAQKIKELLYDFVKQQGMKQVGLTEEDLKKLGAEHAAKKAPSNEQSILDELREKVYSTIEGKGHVVVVNVDSHTSQVIGRERAKQFLKEATSIASSVSRVLRFRPRFKGQKKKPLEEGKISKSIIYRAGIPDHRIFEKNRIRNLPMIDAYLMIDASGSMAGEKSEIAAKASMTFARALNQIPNTRIWISSYDLDLSGANKGALKVRIVDYYDPTTKNFMNFERYSTGGYTPSDQALIYARDRLLRQGRKDAEKLVVHVSDGWVYYAYGNLTKRAEGIAQTVNKQMLDWDWNVWHIIIPPGDQAFFENTTVINQLAELPRELSKTINKLTKR